MSDEEERVKIDFPSDAAGGFAAVVSTMKHAAAEMGLVRGARSLLRVNQTDGFDCPGCAWPEPESRSAVEFCENGAKAVAEEATTKRVTPDFFEKWSVAELAKKSDLWLGKSGRLTQPMILDKAASHYRPVAWDEAFALVASELEALRSPDEAAFYTSGRTSNEAAFLYQLFVRMFGTNNLPDCSNMCHESSGVGLTEVIGIGKGTVTLKDFDAADCILVIGQNPGTNHPRMLAALQSAARRGARIVAINPLNEAGTARFKHPRKPWEWLGNGTPLASLHLPVRINGDVAVLKGLAKALLLAEKKRPGTVVDERFIEDHTEGFDAFRGDALGASWESIESASGLSRGLIGEAAGMIMGSERVIACWAMGITQHKNAVANVQSIANLLLLGGHIGRRGAGLCPVRGHSNVQGDRTMGIWERPSKEFLDALGAEFGFSPTRMPGLNTVETIQAMGLGTVKFFFALGGNFLSAAPDTAFTAAALRKCRMTVHVSTKLNRSHLVTGRRALILPCLGRTEADRQSHGEQFVSVENSMGVVHASRGRLEPASPHLKSEAAIVAGIAEAAFKERSELRGLVDWKELTAHYDRIRDRISRVVPGFEDYNRRVREPGGFALSNPVRDKRRFPTASGKARFTAHPIVETRLEEGELLMMTIRSHDQYNTTIYGLDDRYRGISGGRRVVLMNENDMKARGLSQGDAVAVTSRFQGEERTASGFTAVPYAIPKGCAASYFPEANTLVPLRHTADKSMTPASKSFVVIVEKSG